MKKIRFMSLVLAAIMLLSIPSFAVDTRASEQIHMHIVYVEATIYGTEIMDKIGCQSIHIFEDDNGWWSLCYSLFEDDEDMSSTDTFVHDYTNTFESEVGVDYHVLITVFAENENGRDTRTYEYYVTGI